MASVRFRPYNREITSKWYLCHGSGCSKTKVRRSCFARLRKTLRNCQRLSATIRIALLPQSPIHTFPDKKKRAVHSSIEQCTPGVPSSNAEFWSCDWLQTCLMTISNSCLVVIVIIIVYCCIRVCPKKLGDCPFSQGFQVSSSCRMAERRFLQHILSSTNHLPEFSN